MVRSPYYENEYGIKKSAAEEEEEEESTIANAENAGLITDQNKPPDADHPEPDLDASSWGNDLEDLAIPEDDKYLDFGINRREENPHRKPSKEDAKKHR